MPLCYLPLASPDPFANGNEIAAGNEITAGREERLYCFELDEGQCLSFEPDKNALLGGFVFGGLKDLVLKDAAFRGGEAPLELPAGDYLFAQKREILDRESVIDMAVEIQQEGLWQRLKLGRRLYLRRLFEDGSEVTQLFRPFSTSST